MGNKQSKEFCESIPKDRSTYESLGKALDFTCLSQEKLVEHIAKLVFPGKDPKSHAFDKSRCLNSPPDENEEELKAKRTAAQQQKLQSALAAGHEQLPEVKAIFHSTHLDEFPAQRTDVVRNYSQAMVQRLAAALVLFLSSSVSAKEATSFYARIEHFLAAEERGGSGNTLALQLAVLLMNNQKQLSSPPVVENLAGLFTSMQPLALYGWTREALQVAHALDIVKQGLEAQAKTGSVPAILATCHLGLADGSVEDVLVGVQHMFQLQEKGVSADITEVLKKLAEGVPEVARFFPAPEFDIAKESIEFEVPFEHIYIKSTTETKESNEYPSSAAAGEYVYVHSQRYGMLVLGSGRGKVAGKIYAESGKIETKDDDSLQLFVVRGKLYCFFGNKFSRLDPWTLVRKESKKFACVTEGEEGSDTFVTATGDTLIVYRQKKKQDEENSEEEKAAEKVKGTATYFDLAAKVKTKSVEILHTVPDLKQVVAVGSTLIFAGDKRYETIEIVGETATPKKSGESELLATASLCVSPETHDIFLTYQPDEELLLAKLAPLRGQTGQDSSFESKLAEVKQLLGAPAVSSGHNKEQLAEMLGFHQAVATGPETRVSSARADLLLALLEARAAQARAVMESLKDSEQVVKLQKVPLAIHLTSRSLTVQMELAEQFYREKKADSLDKLQSILSILNTHLIAMGRCDLSVKECLDKAGLERFDKLCAEVLTPIAKDKVLVQSAKTPEEKKLAESIVRLCDDCMANSRLHVEGASTPIKDLAQWLKTAVSAKSIIEESFYSLAAWLAIPEKAELVAQRFLDGDQDVSEFLASYFALEYECVKAKLAGEAVSCIKVHAAIRNAVSGLVGRIFISFAYFCSDIILYIDEDWKKRRATDRRR